MHKVPKYGFHQGRKHKERKSIALHLFFCSTGSSTRLFNADGTFPSDSGLRDTRGAASTTGLYFKERFLTRCTTTVRFLQTISSFSSTGTGSTPFSSTRFHLKLPRDKSSVATQLVNSRMSARTRGAVVQSQKLEGRRYP